MRCLWEVSLAGRARISQVAWMSAATDIKDRVPEKNLPTEQEAKEIIEAAKEYLPKAGG